MDIANSLLELVNSLWGLASRPLGYICNLKANVQRLRNETDMLKAVSKDVLAKVELEEGGGGVQRTGEVEYWLDTVQKFLDRVDQVLREAEERDRIKCLSRCLPPNCRSGYKLGKRVYQMLNEARGNRSKEGEFVVVTLPLPPPRLLEMPKDNTVGLDVSRDKVWKWLVDEKEVGAIGLYGIGGVGKTTLMKRINAELSHANHGFDVVIWVVVSKQVNEDSIRDVIRKRLQIQDRSWDGWTGDERVHHLCDVLTRKKFVLLIDDVWQGLDLSNIGVPRHGLKNGSKVVFTTRLKDVCDLMEADKTLEVQCLTREEALKLFKEKVGKSLVRCCQEIQDLAEVIVEECKGLPLALITVGRTMATKDNPREWRHALTTLRKNPHRLSGMEENVFHILEYSYNSLNDSTRKACFLYCCLFPGDYPIRTDGLIELWIGEGLLRDTDVYRMRDEGEAILEDLKRACLLESGLDVNGRPYVKMQHVIRAMATWIARDHGQRENKLLVIENEEDMSGEMISKWGEAEKVSLWGKWIQNINQTLPQCSQLETLLVRETNVSLVPEGFFDSMKARLTVLDLSKNISIGLFPKEICDLIYLRYLNLSSTHICELPQEIKNLTRLRWLLLDDIFEKILIPTGAFTSLQLHVFSRWVPMAMGLQVKEEEIVKELECMQYLTDLSIIVSELFSALKIFESPNLQRSIRRASIIECEDLTHILIQTTAVFLHLEELHLSNCPLLVKVEINQGIGRTPYWSCFPSLVHVRIYKCGVSDLSWLVHAPKLQELTVEECHSMKKIIGDGFTREELVALGLFSRLQHLALLKLPKLTSICDHALSFPHGASFRINRCPGLRKLPLDLNDGRGRSFSIDGDPDWWAEFACDPAARVTFQRLYGIESPAEEMAFGEAVRKIKDEGIGWAKIGLGPSGPTE